MPYIISIPMQFEHACFPIPWCKPTKIIAEISSDIILSNIIFSRCIAIDHAKYDMGTLCCVIDLQGIGDSGQGFTNAILFLLFTKSMWRSFLNVFRCRYGEIKDEETMSSGSDPNHSQVSVQTTSQNGEDADNNESKPFYVAALLSNNPPHYGSNVNQPV